MPAPVPGAPASPAVGTCCLGCSRRQCWRCCCCCSSITITSPRSSRASRRSSGERPPMLKSILKFLLWLLVIALVCGAVIGYFLWKGKPLGDALLVLAALAVIVVLFLVIRRLWVRHRAKKQVQKLISEEKVRREGGLDWSPRALRRDLKSRWQ